MTRRVEWKGDVVRGVWVGKPWQWLMGGGIQLGGVYWFGLVWEGGVITRKMDVFDFLVRASVRNERTSLSGRINVYMSLTKEGWVKGGGGSLPVDIHDLIVIQRG